MGKKGTKRKTKWRTLPLGEEAGGSGNEEDLHDEDQSTTSSGVTGQPTNLSYKRQSFYYKMADKPFRQTKRFTYDRFKSKEPLVKLESKTFDEEEYTKITTPRQDVLFKKGYFGRKRESSVEETTTPTGEMDGEEAMMDQIIITNGFVDERGHYLVNGNSYEIYDPYSNTVTVVVGPPPYANGVSQPVLAAVSCQPVPLQPVDWYPPGADWPSQGSAWTPSYPRTPHSDSVSSPDGAPSFPSPDAQTPSLYNQPAYVVQGYPYGESTAFNGVPLQMNPPPDPVNSDENSFETKKTRRKSTEAIDEEETVESKPKLENEVIAEEVRKSPVVAQHIPEIAAIPPSESLSCKNDNTQVPQNSADVQLTQPKQVEKQSHSTQTNLPDAPQHQISKPFSKESHSTQTPQEDIFPTNKTDSKAQEKNEKNEKPLSDIQLSEKETKPTWRQPGNRFVNSVKKFREESPRKNGQQRTNFAERKLHIEKPDSSPMKVSYAKKAMSNMENTNPETFNEKFLNGKFKNPSPVVNGIQQVLTTNGTNKANNANNAKTLAGYEDKRNGFVKTRYNRWKTINESERTSQKYKDKKLEFKPFDEPTKKCVETAESRSLSEKSSTVSELSSPTELSSGQNTPPEKLIVQKMEEEINRNFEQKLKQNLTKTEKEEDKREEKTEEKPKGKKKKKDKVKPERNNSKELARGNKKKKRAEEEAKVKSESDNSSEEIPFLLSSWQELKHEGQDFISDMDSLLKGKKEILKSLGLDDDRTSYSKLPLHSDLVMLPAFGWSGRPKLKIEDFFAPSAYNNDLFTKRNITNMKSTKPEEFFASVVDGPVVDKTEKKKEAQKKASKTEEALPPAKKSQKTGYKVSKKKSSQPAEEKKVESEGKDGKLGIVEAVNSWLQEQDGSKKFSVERFENLVTKDENSEEETDRKNGVSNPIHVQSRDEDSASVADFRGGGGCIRVANVISDGFVRTSREFSTKKKENNRMYRSSSWDAKLSDVKLKKHFKFLTDSASFCQDLISDVRNGLPTGNEYATEELCDPKQTVVKYYTLAPNGRLRSESDSENEVFDALEYKFLTKENQEADGKSPDGNGNASITDSGVHSDMESSEDYVTEQQKETTCKLQ